ncbi:hypothetical protein [Curtobacterium sp. RRHDQ10]|uniref:hypothetical protein n=1 Tax=Curtobacterium phyllosphaerae TaxID=3413379 RepID=UPI003BF28466
MFINTTNSASESELTDEFRSYEDQIRRMLGLLDGQADGRFAYALWWLPDDAGWPDRPGYTDGGDHSLNYLQAGGAADRMAVDLQILEDGRLRHFVVGRPHDLGEPLTEQVRVAGHDHDVHPAEVFDADEATVLFSHYFEHPGTVPDGYVLRLLDLS